MALGVKRRGAGRRREGGKRFEGIKRKLKRTEEKQEGMDGGCERIKSRDGGKGAGGTHLCVQHTSIIAVKVWKYMIFLHRIYRSSSASISLVVLGHCRLFNGNMGFLHQCDEVPGFYRHLIHWITPK